MASISSISSSLSLSLTPVSAEDSTLETAALDRVSDMARECIKNVSELTIKTSASVGISARAIGLMDYKELTRRIPSEHLSAIEAKMLELSRDPKMVERNVAFIRDRLVDGAYDSLPENYYYYGLIGVQIGSLSVEQFTILVDYLTLSAQGVKPDVFPLFFINDKGSKVLNYALADSILYTLKDRIRFDSPEEGYAFLEATFKDLPPEALHVQVYDATWDPTKEVVLPEGCDPRSYAARLVKHHDVPVIAKLFTKGFNILNHFQQDGKWKRLSVPHQFYQCLLHRLFRHHAVKINPVLGNSSVADLRHNARTSCRDQGMAYITPAANDRGYDYHCSQYADTYPVVDLDFRDHDRYHAWTCSSLHSDQVRYPLSHVSDYLTRFANLISYLREKDPKKKADKKESLSAVHLSWVDGLEKGISKEALQSRLWLSARDWRIIENLVTEDSGDKDLRALRHIAWDLTDMDFIVSGPDSFFKEEFDEAKRKKFASSFLEKIFHSKIFQNEKIWQSLGSLETPIVERAQALVRERVNFPGFTSLRMRYDVEMMMLELGMLPNQTVACIRQTIHGKDTEPSYEDWLLFRKLTDEEPLEDVVPLNDLEVEEELLPVLRRLATSSAAAAGAGSR